MNSGEDRTFLRSALHGGHQSEPLKSINTIFFSSLALALAFARSVNQSSSAEQSWTAAQHASNKIPAFFMVTFQLFQGDLPHLRPASSHQTAAMLPCSIQAMLPATMVAVALPFNGQP